MSRAQNRTFDDANGVISYNPPNAWTRMKVECALTKRLNERTKNPTHRATTPGTDICEQPPALTQSMPQLHFALMVSSQHPFFPLAYGTRLIGFQGRGFGG